jgi:predicted anti-sigma-YlaC factor YlaD
MNCINSEIIQKYIDGETSPKDISVIEKHIAECEKCAAAVNNQRLLSTGIKNAMNLLVTEKPEIPTFVASEGRPKKRYITTKRIIYSLSAACVLFVVFIVVHKKEPKVQEQITIINSFGTDYDANRPVAQQEMVIKVIDSEGKVTEY